MSRFQVHDEVICINDMGAGSLRNGATYHISHIITEGVMEEHVKLFETPAYGGWYARRFKLTPEAEKRFSSYLDAITNV